VAVDSDPDSSESKAKAKGEGAPAFSRPGPGGLGPCPLSEWPGPLRLAPELGLMAVGSPVGCRGLCLLASVYSTRVGWATS
jgi:hypothetical protein